MLEIVLANRLEEIERCLMAFNAYAEQQAIGDPVRRSLDLVLDEFLNNVISYAFDDDGEHEIVVRVELGSDRITLSIEDDGKPFDPFARPAPDTTLSLEDRAIGGLGIHLVEELMDDVAYERKSDRNMSVLSKNLTRDESST